MLSPFRITIVQLSAKLDPVSMVQRKQLLRGDNISFIQRRKERCIADARVQVLKKQFFENLHARISDTTFFAPLNKRDVIAAQQLLPLDHTYWIQFCGELYDRYAERRTLDLTSDIPGTMSVSQLCIMAAIYK